MQMRFGSRSAAHATATARARAAGVQDLLAPEPQDRATCCATTTRHLFVRSVELQTQLQSDEPISLYTVTCRCAMIAFVEGISFLVLMGIAMPLKYALGLPLAVKYLGWIYGLLFFSYMASAFLTARVLNWPFKRLFLAGVAAHLQFGPFVFDNWSLKKGNPR